MGKRDVHYVGSAKHLREWQKRMNFTYDDAAAALGMSRSGYANYLSGTDQRIIDLRTALACAAIEHGLEPMEGGKFVGLSQVALKKKPKQ